MGLWDWETMGLGDWEDGRTWGQANRSLSEAEGPKGEVMVVEFAYTFLKNNKSFILGRCPTGKAFYFCAY